MKTKPPYWLLVAILFSPLIAFATPSTVNRITDHIQPLINGDFIKAQYFTATSTTNKSTFPYASSTAFSATTICFTGDLPCRTTWPSGSGGGIADPFSHTTNYNTSVSATTTVVWFQSGLQASSTSQIAYASTTMISATTASSTNLIVSSAGGSGTRCLQVAADGTISANSSACATATGYPFTPSTQYGQSVSGTTTALYLTGSPISLMASSTSVFNTASSTNASSSLATLGTTWLTSVVGSTQCLHVDSNGKITGTGADCGSAAGLSSYDAWTHPAAGQSATTSLILLNGQASSTQLSAYKAYFGATATSTVDGTGLFTFVTAPVFTTLTGIIQGKGATAASAITDSSTVGQVLRVTGASAYAWGALDLANSSAVTGDLPFANLAQVSANSVLGNITGATADAASIATSSLYTGSNGQVLARVLGTWIGVATTTFSTGLTYAAGAVTCDTATASIFGCLSAANWTTFNAKQAPGFQITTTTVPSFAVGNALYITGTSPTTIAGTATSSLTASGVVSVSNSPAIFGSSAANITITGGSNSQVLAWAAGIPTWVATTTFSTGVTYAGGAVTCDTASASVFGCLTSANWSTFNSKLGSYDAFTHTTWNNSATTSSIGIGSTTPFSTLSVSTTTAGYPTSSLFAVASNTNATLFNVLGNGNVGIGTTSPFALLSIAGTTTQWGSYAHFGTVECKGTLKNVGQAIELCGDNNSASAGVQLQAGNNNGGSAAFGCLTLNNDLAINAGNGNPHYAVVCLNSSTYNDVTFGTGHAMANQMEVTNTDGPLSLAASTSTTAGFMNFLTGGAASSSEHMRITPAGRIGVGSSTPLGVFTVEASSTYNGQNSVLFLVGSTTAAGIDSALFQVSNTGLASTTNLNISGVSQGQTGTTCLQITTGGVVQSTGSACGAGGGGIADPFTHPAAGQSATTSLMLFNGQSSSTQESAYKAYFGGTATSTFDLGGIPAFPLTGILQGKGAGTNVSAISDSSTAGQVLRVTGASTYAWGALDLSNTSAVTNRLAFANLTQGAANTVLANTTGATADFAALATSSLFAGSNGQVLARVLGTWTGVATTTFSTGLTYSAGAVTCDVASASIPGCLSAANWTTFNNKIGSYDAFTHPNAFSSATTTMILIGTSTGQVAHVIVGSSTAPQIGLSDNTAGDPLWTIRNMSGNLAFATTSATGVSTSTPTALQINNSGVGLFVGTTTNANASGLAVAGTGFWSGLTSSGSSQAGDICISSVNQLINDSVACIVSARRFKQNIKPLDSSLGELLKFQPVSFFYKPEFNGNYQSNPNYNGEQVGLIADDVQKIDPRLTTIELSGEEKGMVQSVRYQNITAIIIGAVQEQQKEILDLQIAKGLKRSAEENWQNILIGLLLAYALYNEWGKRRRL